MCVNVPICAVTGASMCVSMCAVPTRGGAGRTLNYTAALFLRKLCYATACTCAPLSWSSSHDSLASFRCRFRCRTPCGPTGPGGVLAAPEDIPTGGQAAVYAAMQLCLLADGAPAAWTA